LNGGKASDDPWLIVAPVWRGDAVPGDEGVICDDKPKKGR